MHLSSEDVPVAYSMMRVVRESSLDDFPFDKYCCCWMAFNNIYAKLSEGSSFAPQLTGKKHSPIGGVVVPKVNNGSEQNQIRIAVRGLPSQVKHWLIDSKHMKFFVDRTPKLGGESKPIDPCGQRLNGVLNIGHTLATRQLIWQPIDGDGYRQYKEEGQNEQLCESLTHQIVMVLYTVRNNLFHGGKIREDENDEEVIRHALCLLMSIIDAYIRVGCD
jgi:hypothetical protein